MREHIMRNRGKATLAILFGGVMLGLAYRLANTDEDFDIWADY